MDGDRIVAADRAHEEQLRRAFAALRTSRAGGATTFTALIPSDPTHAPGAADRLTPVRVSSWPTRRRIALAFAIVPLVIAASLHVRARAQLRADVALARAVAPLVSWQSPTRPLLTAPFSTTTPSLDASVIVIPVPATGGIQ